MDKEKKENQKMKIEQCFVCLCPVQIPVDSPKGVVLCPKCAANSDKDKEKSK
jgi:hypothetical protein